MVYTFNKTLLVILSLSSLLLSSNAVPSTRVNDFISTSVPAAARKSSFIDFTSTSFSAKAPSSIDFISTSFPSETPSSIDFISNVVPSTRVNDFISTSVPAATPTSTSSPVEAPSSIKPDANHDDDSFNDYPDSPSIDPTYCIRVPEDKFCNKVPINITNVDPEILKTCNGEPYGSLIPDCIEILSKLLEGPFDVVKALEIEVNTTGNTVKDIFDVLVKLCNDPSTDKRAIDALDSCRDQYHMMLDSINQILEILRRQNFVDAYDKMDVVLSYRDTCDRSLSFGGLDMPWIYVMPWDRKEELRQMIYICVNILSNIINNHKF